MSCPAGELWCATLTAEHSAPDSDGQYGIGYASDHPQYGSFGGLSGDTFTYQGVTYTVTALSAISDGHSVFARISPSLPDDGRGLVLYVQRERGELALPIFSASFDSATATYLFAGATNNRPDNPPFLRSGDYSNGHFDNPTDEGTRLRVRLGEVANIPATGSPTIFGAPMEGVTLELDIIGINDVNGRPTSISDYSFQWLRVDSMSNETAVGTGSTYTLTAADVGNRVRLQVSFADRLGYAEGPLASIAYPGGNRTVRAAGTRPADVVLLDATLTVGAFGRDYRGCGVSDESECDERMSEHTFSSIDLTGVEKTFGITWLEVGSPPNDTSKQYLTFVVASDTTFREYENHHLVLVLDGRQFAFRTTDTSVNTRLSKQWRDAGLSWSAGQQVHVQIIDDPTPPRTPGASVARVADAEAHEGDGAIEFKVTLNRALDVDWPWSRTVTVAYATADGSAKAGEDYVRQSGRLSFPGIETERTVSVRLIDDQVEDNWETFKLILSDPRYATIADPEATGTIRNTEPLTASFQDVPESHDGSSAFSLRIQFSEELAPGSGLKVAEALSVTGATRGEVRRVAGPAGPVPVPSCPGGRSRCDGEPAGDDLSVLRGGRHLHGRGAPALQCGVRNGLRTRIGDFGRGRRGGRGPERDARLRGEPGPGGLENRDGGLRDIGRQRTDIGGRLHDGERNAHVRAGRDVEDGQRDGARRCPGGRDGDADPDPV